MLAAARRQPISTWPVDLHVLAVAVASALDSCFCPSRLSGYLDRMLCFGCASAVQVLAEWGVS
jgi:hypothetical protein